ncbi:MAG: hypothetical protein JXM70_22515 [Pirellulales bacterium]|nr:hypothetical protein [Pirellulales bacterium]
MKIVCYFVLVAGIVCVTASAEADTLVFLLGGQSNMAGVGAHPGDDPIPAPYNVPQTDVKFWNYGPDVQSGVNNPGVGTGWIDLQTGFGYTTGHFGPEITFGDRLKELYPDDDIYLVKEGISGTELYLRWNPDGSGWVYNTFKARVHAALANLTAAGKNPKVAGMIWMQGESDAIPVHSGLYKDRLTNFVQTVRTEFNTPDMRFVSGRILPTFGQPADNALVRDALMTLDAEVGNAGWVNTDDLQLAYSGHYGTAGQLELGRRFANEFASVPEPGVTTLTAIGLLCLLPRKARCMQSCIRRRYKHTRTTCRR